MTAIPARLLHYSSSRKNSSLAQLQVSTHFGKAHVTMITGRGETLVFLLLGIGGFLLAAILLTLFSGAPSIASTIQPVSSPRTACSTRSTRCRHAVPWGSDWLKLKETWEDSGELKRLIIANRYR